MTMRVKFLFLATLLLASIGLTARAQIAGIGSKTSFSRFCSSVGNFAAGSIGYPGTGRLARITAYWPGEDYYTTRRRSATGIRLRFGFCAVDSSVIPYGSLVTIYGLGTYLAVDTGSAVISRKAARESGQSWQERSALVVDLFFPSRRAGEHFAREGPKFATVSWQPGDTIARD
jgi:hypothetical protein